MAGVPAAAGMTEAEMTWVSTDLELKAQGLPRTGGEVAGGDSSAVFCSRVMKEMIEEK